MVRRDRPRLHGGRRAARGRARQQPGARLQHRWPGLTRADDDLPERLKTEPIPQGPAKGHMISQADLDLMLDEYYEARGWTPDGVPTRAKLEELAPGLRRRQAGPRVITSRVRTIGLLKSLLRQGELRGQAAGRQHGRRPARAPGRRLRPRRSPQHLIAPGDADAHPPLRVMVNGRDIGVLGGRATRARRRGRRARAHAHRRQAERQPGRNAHEDDRLREPLHHPGVGRRAARSRDYPRLDADDDPSGSGVCYYHADAFEPFGVRERLLDLGDGRIAAHGRRRRGRRRPVTHGAGLRAAGRGRRPAGRPRRPTTPSRRPCARIPTASSATPPSIRKTWTARCRARARRHASSASRAGRRTRTSATRSSTRGATGRSSPRRRSLTCRSTCIRRRR